MAKQKVYIAGKITGTDKQECIKKFQKVSDMITVMGFEPVNPMTFGIDWNASLKESMEICIPKLLESDILFMLSDWRTSPGANIEFQEWYKEKYNHDRTLIMEEEKGFITLAQLAELSMVCA